MKLEYDRNGNLLVDMLCVSNKVSSGVIAVIDGKNYLIRSNGLNIRPKAPTEKDMIPVPVIEAVPMECGEAVYFVERCRPRKGFANKKLNECNLK